MNGEQVRVLVVDDEEAIRNLLQRILREAGYQVTTAANGKDALYKVSLGEAEVVLLDIKMPGKSGLELLPEIRKDYPNTVVIMSTAITDNTTIIECMKEGDDLIPMKMLHLFIYHQFIYQSILQDEKLFK